jgi:hypothetical protein
VGHGKGANFFRTWGKQRQAVTWLRLFQWNSLPICWNGKATHSERLYDVAEGLSLVTQKAEKSENA